MPFPQERPRRLRRTPAMRRLVADVHVTPADLVLPLFHAEGLREPRAIGSMPGVVQHSRDSVRRAAAEAVSAGVGGLMLFALALMTRQGLPALIAVSAAILACGGDETTSYGSCTLIILLAALLCAWYSARRSIRLTALAAIRLATGTTVTNTATGTAASRRPSAARRRNVRGRAVIAPHPGLPEPARRAAARAWHAG